MVGMRGEAKGVRRAGSLGIKRVFSGLLFLLFFSSRRHGNVGNLTSLGSGIYLAGQLDRVSGMLLQPDEILIFDGVHFAFVDKNIFGALLDTTLGALMRVCLLTLALRV